MRIRDIIYDSKNPITSIKNRILYKDIGFFWVDLNTKAEPYIRIFRTMRNPIDFISYDGENWYDASGLGLEPLGGFSRTLNFLRYFYQLGISEKNGTLISYQMKKWREARDRWEREHVWGNPLEAGKP